MIVSDVYKYVFLAVPRTGSNAVAKELVSNYCGYEVLWHHALYKDFLKIATSEQREYMIFFGVRNPLNTSISGYYKYLTDHRGVYSKQRMMKGGRAQKYVGYFGDQARYRYLLKNPDFEAYFLRFYRYPYANWSLLYKDIATYVLRHENIGEDFRSMLRCIGADMIRELPSENATTKAQSEPSELFVTETVRKRAKGVFSGFMQEWDYDFPSDWAESEAPGIYNWLYPGAKRVYFFYWNHVR